MRSPPSLPSPMAKNGRGVSRIIDQAAADDFHEVERNAFELEGLVRRERNRASAFERFPDERRGEDDAVGIERGERLIHQEHAGRMKHRASECKALFHSAREGAHAFVGGCRETHAFEPSRDVAARAAMRTVEAVNLRVKLEVFVRGQIWIEEALMRQDADAAA